MLGPVGKGWSREATREAPVERQRRIRQRSVTGTRNLTLWSRVSRVSATRTPQPAESWTVARTGPA
jgi:hypothetical protein